MTDTEKLLALQNRIKPDVADEAVLSALLEQAGAIVLNRRFPFGYPAGTAVPRQYGHVQVSIALELYNKNGAEGQTAHSENGISRTYESADVSSSLLKQIIPIVGSVIQNADA
jgi:hypothetical protein